MLDYLIKRTFSPSLSPYLNCSKLKAKEKPTYFCTVQKSETNLLLKILNLFEIKTGFHQGHKHLCEKKDALDQGVSFSQVFNSQKKCVVLYRDPRDCVISQIFHKKNGGGGDVKKLVDRPLLNQLSMGELISKSLNYEKISKNAVGSYARHLFQSFSLVQYLLKHPHKNRLLIRFEDLVPAFAGGADESKRFTTFKKICEFAHKDVSDEKIYEVMEACWGGTPTFRVSESRKVGQWKKYFEPHHVKLFQKKFTSILMDLGYETDSNWSKKY